MTYICTHALILLYNKHITMTDIQWQISGFIMNSYNKLIHIFVLIVDLYLFRSPEGVIKLILIQMYP